MTNNVISAGEAWEEVERLKVNINFNHTDGKWYAHTPGSLWDIGWGDSPLEAIACLLARLGKMAAAKAEAASV